MIFKGVGTALVTPFDEDNNINYNKLEELIEFQILNKVDAIIVCGTTGEAATLSLEEKKELIKFVVNKVNKRIKVIAGTGLNNTEECIKLSKYAEDVNVDGLLIVTPYYNKTNQEGLIKHYTKIATSVNKEIIIYNVPSRTGVNILPKTVKELSKITNITGIKEASGNISQIVELASLINLDSFAIYSGNDDQILPILSIGGMGVISTLSNICPYETHLICNYFFTNNLSKAREIQLKYIELIKNIFSDVNPIPIKEIMNLCNYNVGNVRLPLYNNYKNKENELKLLLDRYLLT